MPSRVTVTTRGSFVTVWLSPVRDKPCSHRSPSKICVVQLDESTCNCDMFSSTSFTSNNSGAHQSHPQDHRSGFTHSHSQPFTVAGMSSQSTLQSPSLRSGTLAGSSVAGTLSDLNQSRSHYQPGYLLVSTPLSSICVWLIRTISEC